MNRRDWTRNRATTSRAEAAAAAPGDVDEAATAAPDAADGEVSDDPQQLASVAAHRRASEAGDHGARARSARQLIRDSNRIVATAVLTSPKLTESEVEAFAKMGERVRGRPAHHRHQPQLAQELRHRPRRDAATPRPRPRISMQLMHRLTEKDIKMLTTDRNVPEALRLSAPDGS